jgi:2-C-methyl-D-erythritol 2,4-cyclodiphosphate synthase
MRIGIGFDVHAFIQGRPLVLGGVQIPYDKGLKGHSDADVLTHAVCDALLGALSMGDIGKHFPDDDDTYLNIQSLLLLRRCADMVYAAGFTVENVDAVVIAQMPKLAPYREWMQQNLALSLGINEKQINVKATTTEKLGFAGRGEGIAAQAICLLKEV